MTSALGTRPERAAHRLERLAIVASGPHHVEGLAQPSAASAHAVTAPWCTPWWVFVDTVTSVGYTYLKMLGPEGHHGCSRHRSRTHADRNEVH